MKTILCFVRHGQTDANFSRVFQGRTDISLNQTGIKQVATTAVFLEQVNLKWDHIITSPLKRARESAQIIQERLLLKEKITINDLLIERDFGQGEGVPVTSDNYQQFVNSLFLFMETEAMMAERAKHLLDNVLKHYTGKNIILVSHSHLIKAVFKLFDDSITYKERLIDNAGVKCLIFKDSNQPFITDLSYKDQKDE